MHIPFYQATIQFLYLNESCRAAPATHIKYIMNCQIERTYLSNPPVFLSFPICPFLTNPSLLQDAPMPHFSHLSGSRAPQSLCFPRVVYDEAAHLRCIAQVLKFRCYHITHFIVLKSRPSYQLPCFL